MERDEIHELIMFLKEELSAGRVILRSERTMASLEKVRFGAHGKVDPNTVDSSVRAFALSVVASARHRKLKNTSLRDVQSKYFEILDANFGILFSEMTRHGLSPQQIAERLSSNQNLVNAFQADLPDFTPRIREFWEVFGPIVEAHLEDLPCLKSVYGGDFSPSYTTNVACSVGLYMETLVLPDPLLRVLTLGSAMRPNNLFRYVMKHALNILSYRDLALADIDPPIVVVAPDRWALERNYTLAMTVAAEMDSLIHASRMFGRDFSGVSDLTDFLEQFADADQLVSQLVDPARLLFDVEWSGTLCEQIVRYVSEIPVGSAVGIGAAVYNAILGRMIIANDVLFQSARYGGTPLIDAPTSWQFFQWKYEYDGDRAAGDKRHLLISKALESRMLRGIPPTTLIELRRNGAASELREVIGRGIEAINSASDTALSAVANTVIENIDHAFAEHDRQLRALTSSRAKFFGLDVSRYVIITGTAIAAPIRHSDTLALISALVTATGNPSPAELRKRYLELRAAGGNLRRSPTGIMFRHLKHNFGFDL